MAEELVYTIKAEDEATPANKQATLSLTDLKSGLDLASQAYELVGQAIDATVTPTLALAEQQRDLARVTGTTAEEAGVMIQATDDMGISYGSLLTASKKLNAEGLSLNATNLKELRTQYSTITDPVQKAQFASEKFGRAAGPEMQKALDLSDAAFQSFIDGASESALVLGDDAVQAARDYEIAQDNMADAIQSAQVIIGQELIPVLTDLANFSTENLVPAISVATDTFAAYKTSVSNIIGIYQLLGDQLLVATGQITAGEAATRAGALAHQEATLTTEQLTQATIDATAGLDAHERAALAAATSTDVLTASTYGNITATDLLDASMQKYSATVLFKNAAENLSTEAAIALGVEMGVLDSKTLLATQAVDELKAKYDSNRDGAIDATEAASGYTQAIIELHNNLEALPETTTTNVVTNFITTGGSQSVGGQGSSVGGSSAIGFAEGGISSGPTSGYLATLHGTEAIIPLDGGNVPVELRAPANGGMGGGVTNIYFSYSPMLSLGDRVELETVVKPMFERLGFVVR